MASNFQNFTFKTKDSLHLKLDGDFDGSSAHELINTLIAHSTGLWDIFIDTNNPKNDQSILYRCISKESQWYQKAIKKPYHCWGK